MKTRLKLNKFSLIDTNWEAFTGGVVTPPVGDDVTVIWPDAVDWFDNCVDKSFIDL